MDKPTFALIMKEAFSAYGRDMGTNSGKMIMSSWYNYFGGKPENQFRDALENHIRNSHMQPKVSEILALMKRGKESGGSMHVCPRCDIETEHLYRLGPDYPECVCIKCHSIIHADRMIMEAI